MIKCRPKRDIRGRVVTPARIWLTPDDNPAPPPGVATACVPLSAGFLRNSAEGDKIRLRDARGAQRTTACVSGCGQKLLGRGEANNLFHARTRSAAPFDRENRGVLRRTSHTRIGSFPPLPQTLLLKPGDTLILSRASILGRPATYRKSGELIAPARIGVSLPQMLDHAKPGEPIWFDDGKIGGVFRSVDSDSATVEITQARPEGEKLGAEKGINLPETRIDIPGAYCRRSGSAEVHRPARGPGRLFLCPH